MILKPFDPWKSPLCTCPTKLSLNPYTGCPHGCLYCYASSYIPHFKEPRQKVDLEKRLRREVLRVKPGSLVMMSSSSDPYPEQERDQMITRGCLNALKSGGLRVLVVTKSDLVCRDADILGEMGSAVSITITTLREGLARLLEPGAPTPKKRLEAIRTLHLKGIPVSARIDPLIPGINDSEIEDLVDAACRAGAKHITSSTYKARPDSLRRILLAFPGQSEGLKALFETGSRIGGSLYLPKEIRESLMLRVERAVLRSDMTFASCREGMAAPKGALCDGSHLINR